jgi:hypothetical protein
MLSPSLTVRDLYLTLTEPLPPREEMVAGLTSALPAAE